MGRRRMTPVLMDGFTATGDLVTISSERIEAAAVGVGFPVMVCGHTHVQRNLRLGDGRLLVNPGSVGLPFVLGSPDARYAIIEKRGGDWSVDMIAVPYDRARAQAQARARVSRIRTASPPAGRDFPIFEGR